MSFGVYVHIPYCLQKCVYCDFATVETESSISKSVPPTTYIDRVKKEIALKGDQIGPRLVDTIYFGGGTPSVIAPELLISVVECLKENGFKPRSDTEITLEINPGTLVEKDFDTLLNAGFSRFSVGAQTFSDRLLKKSNRRHSSQDIRDTLGLLRDKNVNYSADILYSLPTQTKGDLAGDLEQILKFLPHHISPYSLTVPEGHPFSQNRAPEDEQVEMFTLLENKLQDRGLFRYEISNFAKPGFESRHNLLYWNDDEYWGVGMSSHSYLKENFKWGARFWNTRSIETYVSQIDKLSENPWSLQDHLKTDGEVLQMYQALTDFFHISLRKQSGINPEKFKDKFGIDLGTFAGHSLEKLQKRGLLEQVDTHFRLSPQGVLLSNLVFAELTFLPSH